MATLPASQIDLPREERLARPWRRLALLLFVIAVLPRCEGTHAIALAAEANQSGLSGQIAARLLLYGQQQPYRARLAK